MRQLKKKDRQVVSGMYSLSGFFEEYMGRLLSSPEYLTNLKNLTSTEKVQALSIAIMQFDAENNANIERSVQYLASTLGQEQALDIFETWRNGLINRITKEPV